MTHPCPVCATAAKVLIVQSKLRNYMGSVKDQTVQLLEIQQIMVEHSKVKDVTLQESAGKMLKFKLREGLTQM
jgi:hypothetical protein